MSKGQRVGIFGGLFDPPHIGHLIIAQAVLDEFRLHQIIFVPAGNPPHKRAHSSYAARYHMTKLAIRDNRYFAISDIEKHMPGKTYTVDVVAALRASLQARLYLIIGSDQWEEIGTWKRPQELFKLCRVIVAPRPGHTLDTHRLSHPMLHVSKTPLLDVSSTMIRKKIKNHHSIMYYVRADVLKYIKRKKLYG
ncbi:MAG: nicotinate (nicotinamide) nucleotide adenylyltransferase [candidate division WOR-3 bacterium]|nr:MAG: nicotinate (nicotinamide) nucleotide adenylyltransferase [candidate division WOR-3 bacterium]